MEREKANPNISTRVSREIMYEYAVNAGNELVGCLQELAIAREYLYDLERIVRLKEEE